MVSNEQRVDLRLPLSAVEYCHVVVVFILSGAMQPRKTICIESSSWLLAVDGCHKLVQLVRTRDGGADTKPFCCMMTTDHEFQQVFIMLHGVLSE